MSSGLGRGSSCEGVWSIGGKCSLNISARLTGISRFGNPSAVNHKVKNTIGLIDVNLGKRLA